MTTISRVEIRFMDAIVIHLYRRIEYIVHTVMGYPTSKGGGFETRIIINMSRTKHAMAAPAAGVLIFVCFIVVKSSSSTSGNDRL